MKRKSEDCGWGDSLNERHCETMWHSLSNQLHFGSIYTRIKYPLKCDGINWIFTCCCLLLWLVSVLLPCDNVRVFMWDVCGALYCLLRFSFLLNRKRSQNDWIWHEVKRFQWSEFMWKYGSILRFRLQQRFNFFSYFSIKTNI